MSSANMKLVLSLTGRDDGAVKLLRETERQLLKSKLSREQLARSNRPYEAAGIRSERAIQREILQTQAAFRRLARSGTASQNDLQRAAVATKNRIRELTAELNQGIEAQGRWGKGLQAVGRVGAGVLAGSMAAYGVLKPAMDDKKQVNANINQVARQAFIEDESKSAEWIATQGAEQVKSLALELIRANGGNHDSALGMISAMMTNGMSFNEVKSDAQTSYAAMMAASENGQYNPDDTAKIMKVFKDAGFNGKDLGLAFEKALQSGLDGNFEIADMVRELPALLPMAQQAGLTGMQGLEYLLAMLQSSANKSGSTGEAATDVRNALSKTLSADTVKRLKDLENPNSPGKGIDWEGSVLRGKANGENAVQVLTRLVDQMLAKDQEFAAYKAKADAGDKTALDQMNIMRGFVLSKVMPDLQAKNGLLAASDKEQMDIYMKSLAGVTPDNGKVDRLNEARMMTDAAQQERDKSIAMLTESMTEPLIAFETGIAGLSAEFPNTTLALQALAAAATAAAVAQGAMAVLSRGGGKGVAGAVSAGAAGVGRAAAGAGKLAGRAAPVLAVGMGVLDAVNIERRSDLSRAEKNAAQVSNAGETGGGLAGALAGGKLGAMIGTAIAPGIGTAVGAALGSIGGGLLGTFAGGWLAGKINGAGESARNRVPEAAKPAPLQPAAKPAPLAAAAPPAPPKAVEPPEKLTPVIAAQTTAYQTAITAQTAQYQAAVAADTAAVTSALSAINGVLAELNQTINNNMTVHLDGRVIANEVSRHQVAMFGRGAAQ
ncbi:phage tail tape measure protein [Bergeriella denitrificans]|uniref:Phage-related minor tail protein n=1 Tax=Bergeriella denitrificans TaxID=494 RepID=A0A378UGD9_BERDE|nr:phage tail tape measure protein [Bergeriella denitrificans]STZ75571.1 Phage-related minor tail protein [Bergeriella denitrificans]